MGVVKGINFVVEINTGTVEVPVWTKIAGQRTAELTVSVETMDSTTKDSDGWAENEAGLSSWEVSADGLIVVNDEGFAALEDSFLNKEKVRLQIATPSGGHYSGNAIVTELPISLNYDDLVTWSTSFTGSGKLEKTEV